MQERWCNVRDGVGYNGWLTVDAREPEQRQRGQLLSILLVGLCAFMLALTAINGVQLAVTPSSESVSFVIGDVFSVLVLVGLWRWNRSGHTQSASYMLLALLVIGCSTLLPMNTLDRTLIVYAIPIMAASFLVRPGSSFVFALLSALGYSLAWLADGSASTYNYVSVLSLPLTALLSWLIATRLEKDRIERKQAEEALLRRTLELTALQATVLDITSPHPLPVLLRIIVERAANLLSATSGALYLTEPEHRRVRCVVSYNTPRDFTGMLLNYGEGAAGHVAQTGQPLIIDDYRAWSGRASAFEDERPFQAVISAPLLWRGSVTGIVHVLREASAGRFSQPDLDLLAMFANHAAVAVENARLHSALEQELAERRRAEAALRASERRFRVAAESLSDLIYEWDLGDSVEWYGDIDRRLGYPTGGYPRTLDGWAASLHPEDKERVWAAVEDQLERVAPYDVEYRVRTRDGEWRWWSARGAALRNEQGEPFRWIGSITDITERKRVEEVLGLQSAALDAAANAIVITDREGAIQWANPAFTALTGYIAAEAVGKNPRELVKSGQHDQVFYKDLWDTILAGQIWRGELINRRKDGRLYDEEMTITPLQDEHGQISHFIAIKQDITERRRAEEALRESEQRYHSLFENMLEGFAYCRMLFEDDRPQDFIYLEVNSAFEELTGLKNVVGRRVTEVIPGIQESNPELFEIYGRVALTGRPEQLETYLEALGIWFSISVYSPAHGYFVAVFENITKRKRAEEALSRQAEELAALQATVLEITTPHDLPDLLQVLVERAARLLNADGGGLYLCDPERREARCVVSYNTPRDYTGAVLKYGEGAAGSVAGSGEALIIEDYRAWPGRAAVFEAEQPFRSVLTVPMLWRGQVTGVIHTLRFAESHPFTQEDLELLTLFASHAAIATENARLLQGLQLELAERKQAEAALRESEAKYRTLYSSMSEGVALHQLMFDSSGQAVDYRVLDVNPAFEAITGLSRADAAGSKASELYGTGEPPYLDIYAKVATTGEPARFETSFAPMRKTFAISASSPGPGKFATVFEDITEHKQMNEQLRQTLAQMERSNTELEQFAYVASHDLQEPLRMVTSYLQLLGHRYQGKLDADADEFIGYAVDGASRMRRLINDLLAYSRVGTRGKPFEPTDCNFALDHALANLQIAIEETGAAVTSDPLPTVVADEGQLVQLFQNLIGNACKFHGAEPPRVHVSARQVALQGDKETGGQGDKEKMPVSVSPGLRVPLSWEFSVRDNGIGIDPQQFERMFMIFQRLHTVAEYPGTGIGLAICKKIVGRHGGRIWVESQPGQGSTFYFTLPAQQKSAESNPA